jgi:hypothetical protein
MNLSIAAKSGSATCDGLARTVEEARQMRHVITIRISLLAFTIYLLFVFSHGLNKNCPAD